MTPTMINSEVGLSSCLVRHASVGAADSMKYWQQRPFVAAEDSRRLQYWEVLFVLLNCLGPIDTDSSDTSRTSREPRWGNRTIGCIIDTTGLTSLHCRTIQWRSQGEQAGQAPNSIREISCRLNLPSTIPDDYKIRRSARCTAEIQRDALCLLMSHRRADSMEAIAPTAKKMWGRCPKSPPQEFYFKFYSSRATFLT